MPLNLDPASLVKKTVPMPIRSLPQVCGCLFGYRHVQQFFAALELHEPVGIQDTDLAHHHQNILAVRPVNASFLLLLPTHGCIDFVAIFHRAQHTTTT